MSETEEVKDLRQELEFFKGDMGEQLRGVRSDLKELTKALRDLIRLDGDMKRQNDLLMRVANQVDDVEKRVRMLEINNSNNTVRLGFSEWGVRLLFGGSLSMLTGLIVWAVK